MDKDLAFNDCSKLQVFCGEHGLELAISNHNAHWRIYRRPDLIAEWWPGSDKLVLERKYDDWIECPTVDSVVESMKSYSRHVSPSIR
jgi:hypothetical protein